MNIKKEKVITAINSLPEEFDVDEAIEKIILIAKIEEGIKDCDNGNTISHEDAVKYFKKKWSK